MKKIILGVFLSAFLFACNNEKAETTGTTDAATTTETKTGDELLAISEGDGVKSSMLAFSKGDVDGMTANYDDNVRQLWSGGDSLIGKKAVQDYYNGRLKLIDSITYSENVLLPVKVNNQQSQYQALGKWVLHWTLAHVKYKNGKKLNFWIHTDYHYNDAGKIDIVIQYIDRNPIVEATKDLMK